jgi:hypothetical protein
MPRGAARSFQCKIETEGKGWLTTTAVDAKASMADNDSALASPASPPAYTLRLTFAYKGRAVQLVRTQRVAMVSPPSVTPPPEPGQAGYWFEVRDATGALIFHRAIHSPVRTDVEVHSNDPKRSITRVPIDNDEGEFELLVPDLPNARSFAFYGTPGGVRAPNPPSTELLRLDFDALRKTGSTH